MSSTKSSIRPIPITVDEDERRSKESSMSNKELISIIQSLIGSLNEAKRPQFKGLAKKKEDLLICNKLKIFTMK